MSSDSASGNDAVSKVRRRRFRVGCVAHWHPQRPSRHPQPGCTWSTFTSRVGRHLLDQRRHVAAVRLAVIPGRSTEIDSVTGTPSCRTQCPKHPKHEVSQSTDSGRNVLHRIVGKPRNGSRRFASPRRVRGRRPSRLATRRRESWQKGTKHPCRSRMRTISLRVAGQTHADFGNSHDAQASVDRIALVRASCQGSPHRLIGETQSSGWSRSSRRTSNCNLALNSVRSSTFL